MPATFSPTVAAALRPGLAAYTYDVLIIGAGSAGLTAALTLGRSLRRVLLADGGPPRNEPSTGVHGFLSRDGIRPNELLREGREQLRRYETVEVQSLQIDSLRRQERGFEATGRRTDTDAPVTFTARRVLLATGVSDVLPPLPGFRELWGTGVLHCPFCHGWEVRDQPVAVYGKGHAAVGLALLVSRLTPDVVLVTDGPGHLTPPACRRLKRYGIGLREEKILRLVGHPGGRLEHIEFEASKPLTRTALFIHPPQLPRSPLVADLGARFTAKGALWVSKFLLTSVPNLYAAGDITPSPQQALVAAAEGNQAAIYIHEGLTKEECP